MLNQYMEKSYSKWATERVHPINITCMPPEFQAIVGKEINECSEEEIKEGLVMAILILPHNSLLLHST